MGGGGGRGVESSNHVLVVLSGVVRTLKAWETVVPVRFGTIVPAIFRLYPIGKASKRFAAEVDLPRSARFIFANSVL